MIYYNGVLATTSSSSSSSSSPILFSKQLLSFLLLKPCVFILFYFNAVCGGHLVATATPQMIYSHAKYGDLNYDNRADCEWRLQADTGFRIQLKFRAFELEDEHECA